MRLAKICVCLCLLLITTGGCTKSDQYSPDEHYIDNFPEGFTEIAEKGETVIVANARSLKIRVNIKTHTFDIDKYDPNGPFVKHDTYQECSYTRYPCSIVDSANIAVNGKELAIPSTVYRDLADLNRGRVFLQKNKNVLILDGGDASTGYFVAIEFDREHIIRKAVYENSSLSQDVLIKEVLY